MERATGVEPATSSLGSWHSTTELHPLLAESRFGPADCQLNRSRLAIVCLRVRPNRAIDFDLSDQKTLPMADWRRALVPLIATCLTLACAGCSLFSPKPPPPTPPTAQQLEAYAQQETALRDEASRPQNEHCDELAAATPGVEEIRMNQGAVESRQWTLISNGLDRHWVFVRVTDGSSEGWAPKPGIDKLGFQPPLEPTLKSRPSVFVAYASIDAQNPADSPKSAALRDSFGAAQGSFTWRGHKYAYALSPELPCFPRLQ
jgi:hypothetical protein